jgi:hypothetical protein
VSTTLLNDINDRGQSTGQAFDAADPRNTHYAFLRERDGTITTLPDAPGAAQTIHIGLNNRGQTAATAAFLSADGTFATLRGFRYDDGEPTRIAVPGAVSTLRPRSTTVATWSATTPTRPRGRRDPRQRLRRPTAQPACRWARIRSP